MTGDNINLVNLNLNLNLDLTRQGDRRHSGRKPLAQMRRQFLNVSLVQAQFPAICRFDRFKPMKYKHNIHIRKGWWWPARTVSERRVKTKLAGFASIALAMALGIVMAIAHHIAAPTFGAGNARWPTRLAHKFKAFCVIDQS